MHSVDSPASKPPASGISRTFLSNLHCPYCGFSFGLESCEGEDVEFGVLRCDCYAYPVVEGIPVLRQVDGLERVVQSIANAQRVQAVLRTLELFRVQWALRSDFHRLLYRWDCNRLVGNSTAPFALAARRLRKPAAFADYLIHRYANPSFLAAVGPLMVLENLRLGGARPSVVFDLACGAGHASFLMRLLYPGLHVVSADNDFVNLYLARRYMSPKGVHLCIDAEVPSPFADGFFDAVYCQDAFHYFQSKREVVRELKRILTPEAIWVFPHLHNRLRDNLVAGIPLSPEGYLGCLDDSQGRLFVERELLQGVVFEGRVDLSGSASTERLNDSPTVTYVRGDRAIWRTYDGFPQTFCCRKASLRFNPVYRVIRAGEGCRLELRWPNPVMARECSEAELFLSKECTLSAADLLELRQATDPSNSPLLNDLVANFVLVPLPENYAAEPASIRLDGAC